MILIYSHRRTTHPQVHLVHIETAFTETLGFFARRGLRPMVFHGSNSKSSMAEPPHQGATAPAGSVGRRLQFLRPELSTEISWQTELFGWIFNLCLRGCIGKGWPWTQPMDQLISTPDPDLPSCGCKLLLLSRLPLVYISAILLH